MTNEPKPLTDAELEAYEKAFKAGPFPEAFPYIHHKSLEGKTNLTVILEAGPRLIDELKRERATIVSIQAELHKNLGGDDTTHAITMILLNRFLNISARTGKENDND